MINFKNKDYIITKNPFKVQQTRKPNLKRIQNIKRIHVHCKDVIEDICFLLLHKIHLMYLSWHLVENFREKIQFFVIFFACYWMWNPEDIHTFFHMDCMFFFLFFKSIQTNHILFFINQDPIERYIMSSKLDILLWRSNSISVCVIHLKSHYHKEPFPITSILKRAT